MCPAPVWVLSPGRMGSVAPTHSSHRAKCADQGGEIRELELSWKKSVSLDRQDPTGRSAGCSGIGALLGDGCPRSRDAQALRERDDEREGGRGWVGEQAGGREQGR